MTNNTGPTGGPPGKREKTERIMSATQGATTIIPFVVVFVASPFNHQDRQLVSYLYLNSLTQGSVFAPIFDGLL